MFWEAKWLLILKKTREYLCVFIIKYIKTSLAYVRDLCFKYSTITVWCCICNTSCYWINCLHLLFCLGILNAVIKSTETSMIVIFLYYKHLSVTHFCFITYSVNSFKSLLSSAFQAFGTKARFCPAYLIKVTVNN